MVKNFIKKFKVVEIHYCRSKVAHRQYLASELSINKMAQMYNESTPIDLQVKKSYFRMVFNTNFNLSFKSPATDLCSTCIMLDEKLKHEKDQKKRNELIMLKRVHKLRSKAFYTIAREEKPNLESFSFDCQKMRHYQSFQINRPISAVNSTCTI